MSAGFIFDLDGVVIDSKEVIATAFRQAYLRRFPGEQPPLAGFFARMGKGLRQILADMGLPAAMAQDFVAYSTAAEHRIAPFEGVPQLLRELRATGMYVGLATGKERTRTMRILRNLELLQHFSLVVCSDDVPLGKPDPASIDAHVTHGGLDRSRTFFVGDAPADLQCARNAQVHGVAALWGGITPSDVLLAEFPPLQARTVADARALLMGVAARHRLQPSNPETI